MSAIAAVTGANGFIGRRLCERLERAGWEVRSIVRRDFERGAVSDAFRGAAVVIHAAGATRAPTAAELRASNVELTRRVVDEANRAGVARLMVLSSQAAAGPAAALDAPVDELQTPAPIEAYGQSKLDAEQVVRSTSDVPWTILRPASVYGPGDRDFLPLFRLAGRGIAIHPANRAHWISIVHVDDLIDAISGAAASDAAAGATLFIANDEPAQWSELFKLAARASGRLSAELAIDIEVPITLVRAAALVGDAVARVTGHAGLLTSRKAALSEPRYWICSNAQAKRTLGFEPKVELRDGFADTHRWYREHAWL
ncbi:MAG: NAD-dependent epimerase/dehydratase family protein [Gemmatimonadales bacterium]